jgi:hypothetical protein
MYPIMSSFREYTTHRTIDSRLPNTAKKYRVRSGRDLFRRADWLVHNSTTYIIMHGGDVKQTRPVGMKTDRSGGSVKLQIIP